jgi:hypothetical protein
MGKKMIGQENGQYFLPNHFFAPQLLTSETRHGRCVRRDFWA